MQFSAVHTIACSMVHWNKHFENHEPQTFCIQEPHPTPPLKQKGKQKQNNRCANQHFHLHTAYMKCMSLTHKNYSMSIFLNMLCIYKSKLITRKMFQSTLSSRSFKKALAAVVLNVIKGSKSWSIVWNFIEQELWFLLCVKPLRWALSGM